MKPRATRAIAIWLAAVGATSSAFAATLANIGIQEFELSGERPFEFYDNIQSSGGGFAGSSAITGVVIGSSVVKDGSGFITGFNMLATITNDTSVPLLKTMMTAEFALGNLLREPMAWSPPFTPTTPNIIAQNNDDHAWYAGGYYVPAWDFGDIAPGASVTRQFDFIVDGTGLLFSDSRHAYVEASASSGIDLFANRTSSLKISDWMETFLDDDGLQAFPPDVLNSSNVSVFSQIPEPGSTIPLGLLLGMAAFRRSRRCTIG